MDIPAAEELEWLESNSLLPEFEEEDDYIVEENVGFGEKDLPKLQDPNSSTEDQIQRKRARLEEKERDETCGDHVSDEGRGMKRREMETEEDEDWLRYSPPKEAAADVATEVDSPMPQAFEEKMVSRFASEIEGDCMPVTGPNGDRVYAKMSSVEDSGDQRKLFNGKSINGLLLEPIHTLINGVEQEILRKALQESSESPSRTKHSAIPLVTEQLWVEKYAPNSFTELLSDEQTNREVLSWLKQWDSCVFGSQISATSNDVFSALRRHSSGQKLPDSKAFFSKNRSAPFINQNLKLSSAEEKDYRNLNGVSELRMDTHTVNYHLEQKILLLCGPPGLGKTTLAHVAAKHCGYRVVEINASDERSSSMIESKILDVVQMNSVMADSRPKCLVIDEIDGSLGEGKGAVEVILKMVAAEKKSSVEKGNLSEEAQHGNAPLKKAKQRKTATLLRPVICICNDLYAPALRSLRQVAKLKYICKKEGLKTSSMALSALAEYTECDIRSCLNTLQFLHKKNESLNLLEVGSQVVGRKDMSRSAFDVWKEIFQKRKSKRGRNSMSNSSSHGDFDFLYSLISNRGEYELTMDGIHENFLRLSYHDPMMQKTVRCLDTLGVSDSLLRYILRTQQMALLAYQPPIAIIMRSLIAQIEKPNIEWPKSLQKCRALLMEKKDSIKLWQNKLSPSISRHLSFDYVVEDLISPLLHILSPPTLRPAALHLLTEREKNDLAQLVDTMVSYSVTYKNSKSEASQKIHKHGSGSDTSELSLDPPIDEFLRFQDYEPEHFRLSLAVKQVLVHEVAKQRIMRDSFGRSTNLSEGSNSHKKTPPSAAEKLTADVTLLLAIEDSNTARAELIKRQNSVSTSSISSVETNKASARVMPPNASGIMKKPARCSSSFFDRFRKGGCKGSTNQGDSLQKVATMERDSRPLLFKYNEGFTNAVKRPVKVRELLL